MYLLVGDPAGVIEFNANHPYETLAPDPKLVEHDFLDGFGDAILS